MTIFIVLFVIVFAFFALSFIFVKFGTITGVIVSGILGGAIAHETFGKSYIIMGMFLFSIGSYYCFAPSITSQLIDKIKIKKKK